MSPGVSWALNSKRKHSKLGKNSWYMGHGVNRSPDTKNKMHPPGVSTHARFNAHVRPADLFVVTTSGSIQYFRYVFGDNVQS